MQLGNGNWESTRFNSRLQPTQIALGTTELSLTNLLKLDYEYGDLDWNGTILPRSNNGNIAKQIITVPGVGQAAGFKAVQNYDYDALNRISVASESLTPEGQTAVTGYWRQQFKYDRFGNRTFDEANTTTLPKNCTANNAPAVCPDVAPTVNPSANTANNRLQGYGYDAAGNLTTD